MKDLIRVSLFDKKIPIYPIDYMPDRMSEIEHRRLWIGPFNCVIFLKGTNRDPFYPCKIDIVQVCISFVNINERIEFQIPFERFIRYENDRYLDKLIVNTIFQELHKEAIRKLKLT